MICCGDCSAIATESHKCNMEALLQAETLYRNSDQTYSVERTKLEFELWLGRFRCLFRTPCLYERLRMSTKGLYKRKAELWRLSTYSTELYLFCLSPSQNHGCEALSLEKRADIFDALSSFFLSLCFSTVFLISALCSLPSQQ